ncbi:MAG: ABC-ATPase domain-containing protein, partial [Gammaproteobacteria bacterium]|nr:ABC-ATPase domain-containing protein [Gammaproteobacteria bacterium]
VERHVKTVEDQDMLRNQLVSHRLVGFVADGSILPRKSGIDDHPLTDDPLLFHAPDSLSHTLQLTDSTPVRGLGIPQGVTLIVGGGFHGKSTLLNALEMGVYNHVPDDGRERAVTLSAAVKVRAEDNRSIAHVDIRPFIDRLPRGRDTRRFTTENASGSTSQAANIVEAVETGSRLLLIDEDTSATNFMIRDRRMQALVAPEKEPITPFLYRVRELYEEHGVSSVIVMGGSGDFFEVADTVIMLDNYTSLDATLQARELAGTEVRDSRRSALPPLHSKSSRRPDSNTIDASQGHRETKIDAREVRDLIYGTHSIDLSRVEQLSDIGQTRAIGWMIHYYASHYGDTGQDLISGLEQLLRDVEERGLDILQPYKTGTLALPRLQEVAAAINRMRGVSWN